MRDKTSLALMELLVMVLVFALAAALCLGIFAGAHRIEEETSRREQAAILAQNGAELLKAGRDLDVLSLPEGWRLDADPQICDIPGLYVVKITIFWEETPVFSLETGWQEVLP